MKSKDSQMKCADLISESKNIELELLRNLNQSKIVYFWNDYLIIKFIYYDIK